MFEQSNVTDEQPSQDSTQQSEQDQVNEQPEVTGDEQSESTTDNISTFDIDGEKLTADQIKEWKQGYMRQQDYTKKTQELAEEKRKLGRQDPAPSSEKKGEEVDPELKKALDTLKQHGFATKEDLALMKAQEEDNKKFKKLLKAHPELKTHEKALQQIGRVDNRAWEDIVVDYGFLTSDKLSKAKASKPVVGVKKVEATKQKSVKDMTDAEYQAWKKQNLGDGLLGL